MAMMTDLHLARWKSQLALSADLPNGWWSSVHCASGLLRVTIDGPAANESLAESAHFEKIGSLLFSEKVSAGG